jgi:hypothetical protein
MAAIIRCDGGCGAESPDHTKRGAHVANHWLRVRAEVNLRFDRAREDDDRLYCDACAAPVLATLTNPRLTTQGEK